MVIDTSALVALLLMEPEASRISLAIEADPTRLISAATIVECSIVIESRRGTATEREFDLLLLKSAIRIEAVTAAHAEAARQAWRRFGKGRHGAALNFGDCFSYALARTTGEPLLFKGEGFPQTDILAVQY